MEMTVLRPANFDPLEEYRYYVPKDGSHVAPVICVSMRNRKRNGEHPAAVPLYSWENSPVVFGFVSAERLVEECREIPEGAARLRHPALFEYLQREGG